MGCGASRPRTVDAALPASSSPVAQAAAGCTSTASAGTTGGGGQNLVPAAPQTAESIVSLVATVLRVPLAAMLLGGVDGCWARKGAGTQGPAADVLLRPHVALLAERLSAAAAAAGGGRQAPLVVEDAARHPALRHAPFVAGPPGIRFLAAAELLPPTGGPSLGWLVLLDTAARSLDAGQLDALRNFRSLLSIQAWRTSAAADAPQALPQRTACSAGLAPPQQQQQQQQQAADRQDSVGAASGRTLAASSRGSSVRCPAPLLPTAKAEQLQARLHGAGLVEVAHTPTHVHIVSLLWRALAALELAPARLRLTARRLVAKPASHCCCLC